MRHIIPDNIVNFRDSGLNSFGEIRLQVGGGGIFYIFVRDNFRPELTSDVTCRVFVEEVSVNVWGKKLAFLENAVFEIFIPLTS